MDKRIEGKGRPDSEEAARRRFESVNEVGRILVRKGLLDPGEELVGAMLEDLVHYAYFTGCISRTKVKELLGLTDEAAKDRVRTWKRWHEGNKHCQARWNPMYEAWQNQGEGPEGATEES
ncbi:MAG: hypothetical protein AB1640_14550 [bacterium]